MTQYATGSPVGDRVFSVTQSGASEWQITDGAGASGYIFGRDSKTFPLAFTVDDSGAEGMLGTDDMWAAVRAFAHATRTVEATEEGRTIAAQWQSPGAVGSVLAQFASTGRARLDQLADDAERTQRVDSGAQVDMENLLTPGLGYREPVTARSLATAHAAEFGDTFASTASTVLADIAENYPHLITDAASARDAVNDMWTAWENEV